ncbi:cytochrome b561 domain-containing protein [Ruegeria lacuscaerulensis]|uniref:cytochrome b561 domain-containing protein n=1 Tax=Ruegeria lacuscaerulensis TaxID=55218 RepID=UPI00147FA350|nr:cytochrome b561 domain-containing protein [Ruegeria lacuscaerulensis]
MRYEIPTQGYLPFLSEPIQIHWENHALLMFGIWFVMVPLSVMLLRFGKIKPRTYGIPRGTHKWAWPEFPWSLHKNLLYAMIVLAVAGVGFAMVLTGGFSGTLHAWFGIATVLLGVLQGTSAWFRGSHGGRKDPGADPEDRATWGGDHFDMRPQRWWFEAYHKTAGYFALFCAGGAVATGLSQFWLPGIALAFAVIVVAVLALAVLLQGLGLKHDTYQSVYGSHPDHPYNQRRYGQMFREKGEKP